MENNKNSVQLTGFAGNNPEIKSFGSDKKMARLSIGLSACSKNTANDNQVQWFTLVFWNKKVELIENIVQKGTRFSIEGKLVNNTFTNKNSIKRYATEIIVNSLEVL